MSKRFCLPDATVLLIASGSHETNLKGVPQKWENWAAAPKGRRVGAHVESQNNW